jgi:short-subunit dehydrogenase
MPDFPQKVAIITGAARGIGKAVALQFAQKGWYLALLDLDIGTLTETALEIPEQQRCYICCDVTIEEEVVKAVNYITQKTQGRVDLLVNNAGLIEVGDFDQIPLDTQQKLIDVNLSGLVTMTYHTLPALKNTPGARIINMSSASALIGNPELSVYAATKAAVKSLTEGWSIAFKKYDIKVSDLLPLFVKTRMVYDYKEKYRHMTEKNARLRPEQVAKVVWKASRSNRLHWYVGGKTKAFAFLVGVVPMRWQIPVFKAVIKYR